jgi:DNA invertase Pin-like site-specific DNA recombinase
LELLSACPFSSVIVYDVKRFGRLDNDEAGYYRHILRVHGVEVIYVSENFTGDSTDDLLRPVKQWQAREESKDLSKVTIRGLLSRIEGGYWNGGAPPYGFDLRYESLREEGGSFLFVLRFQPDGSKLVLDESGATVRNLARGERLQVSKRDRSRLAPSASERVEIVRRIFAMSAEDGMGLRAIANVLNVEGVGSPRGPEWARIYSGAWTASTVRSILTNPLYVGDLVWNRRTDARFFKIVDGRASERRDAYGARLVPNPEKDWVKIPNAHPGIVSHRLFEAAQKARSSRGGSETQRKGGRPSAWNGRRSRFLLSGLLECARCGGRYQGCRRTKGKPRNDGSPVRTYYYGCGNYIRKGRAACRFGSVNQEKLEQLVTETVQTYYERYHGEEGRRTLAEVVLDCVGTDSADLAEAKQTATHRLEEIGVAVSRLLDALTDGTRTFVEERLQALDKERRGLETKLRGLEELELSRADRLSLVEECRGFVHDLPGALHPSSPEVRVRTLRRCVERIVVDREAGAVEVRIRPLPVGNLSNGRIEAIARVF